MTGKIVAELHLNTELQIAVRVENALLGRHRTGNDARIGRDDYAAATAVRIAQEFFRDRVGRELLDHRLVDRAAGGHDERFAHLREGLRVDGDAVAHRIAARWKMVRPAHDVNARAFRREREHRQRIGILAANQPAHRPEARLKGSERIAVTAGMHQPLADRRHDLLVLADERAVGADVKLGVEQCADRVRNFLAHADDHVSAGGTRRGAQGRRLGPRNFHRVLEQFDRQPIGDRAGGDVMMIPDRMRRNETLGKADDARAVAACFANEAARLVGRTGTVEKHRRRLHGSHLDGFVSVTHAICYSLCPVDFCGRDLLLV